MCNPITHTYTVVGVVCLLASDGVGPADGHHGAGGRGGADLLY